MNYWFILCLLLPSILITQNSDWVYRNPYPQTDFNATKFFNSNTGFICGASGTMLKTTDACVTFQQQATGMSSSLNSLYFFNELTGFACGDKTSIIFTSNGGVSWSIKAQAINYNSLRSLTFINPNTGFACGTSGLLVKTINTGMNWTLLPQLTNLNLNRVYFLNENKGFLCADSGKIFITNNSGINWTSQNAGLNYQNVKCIEFTDSLKGYIGMSSQLSGSNTNLYKTTDGGVTWQNIYLTMVTISFMDIKFINMSTGFICSDNGPVMITTNSGNLWRPYGLPPSTVMKSISKLDTSVIICGTNGWISRTGSTGIIDVIGGSKKNFISVSFINENSGICIGDYQVNRTVNSGTKWNIQMIGNYGWFEGNTYLIKSFAFPSGNLFVVNHTYIPTWFPEEDLLRSTDGGITWNYCFSSLGYFGGLDEKEGVTYLTHTSSVFKSTGGNFSPLYNVTGSMLGDVSFFNALTGCVISNNNSGNNGLLKTTNGGINWLFTSNSGNKYLLNLEFLPSGTGYAAGNDSGYLIKTIDFGSSWQNINTGFNSYIRDMKFIDGNNGWLLNNFLNPYSGYRLYFTKNGGLNFYPVTSLGEFNVRSFSFVNVNTGFLCGDEGVILKTTNGGLTFVSQNGEVFPESFSLSQNYPNPFNPITSIKFDLPKSGLVELIIYDITGREITKLVQQQMNAGSYSADWDASNYSSGVYFYHIAIHTDNTGTEDFAETKRMILVK